MIQQNQNGTQKDPVTTNTSSDSTPIRSFFPWVPSLRFTVTMAILIPIALVLVASTLVEYNRHRQRDLASMSLLASQTGQVIEQVLHREMLHSDFEAIQSIFDTLSENESIQELLLLDTNGRVIFSPGNETTGVIFDNQDPSCLPCHSLPPQSRPPGVIIDLPQGQNSFRSMQPIENQPECTQCHDPDQRLLGLLLTDLSIAPIQDALAKDLRDALLWWAGTGAVIVLLVNLIINQTVLSRLHKMSGAIARFGEGKIFEALSETPRDEIGRLSAVYNRMVRRIRDRDNENVVLTHKLQQRMSERDHLLRRLINSQEQERMRLARELHDDLGQQLSSITIQLELAQRALTEDADQAKLSISQTQSLIAETTDRMYDVIMGLRPSILDDLGLGPALKNLAKRTLEPAGIQYDVTIEGLEKGLQQEKETAMFRIFQEALNNIVRHSEATYVEMHIKLVDGMVKGFIQDDGVGLDPAPHPANEHNGTGFGLLGMRERAELCGGNLVISTVVPHGTRLRIRIPFVEGQNA
ncbi:MAG: HAMP domain-containing protein [Anaerolineales bacterium]|nr:MAG: HAMP domain-containing protein [Anaerolineales bacterium]